MKPPYKRDIKFQQPSKVVKELIDGKAKYTDQNKRGDIKAELWFDCIA